MKRFSNVDVEEMLKSVTKLSLSVVNVTQWKWTIEPSVCLTCRLLKPKWSVQFFSVLGSQLITWYANCRMKLDLSKIMRALFTELNFLSWGPFWHFSLAFKCNRKNKRSGPSVHRFTLCKCFYRWKPPTFFIRLMNGPFLDIFCLDKKVFQKLENIPFLWQSCFLERNNKIDQREPMHLIDETKAYKR